MGTASSSAGRTDITIDSDGNLTVCGRLAVPIETTLVSADWKRELSGLVKEMTEIRKTYLQSLMGDGRLAGSERLHLSDQLDDALAHLIVIRALIANDKVFTIQDANVRYTHRLDMQLEKNKWDGSGSVGRFRRINAKKFPDWLEGMYTRIQELIRFLGQASADGVIDNDEKDKINKMLDRIIFSIILVREVIHEGQIQ